MCPVRVRLASILAATTIVAGTFAGAEAASVWSSVSEATIATTGDRLIVPTSYVTFEANLDQLRTQLEQAPLEGPAAWSSAIELSLPQPDGTLARFSVIESPIMDPELAARYPEIRTYLGQGVDDPTATVRLDLVPQGFHAMILSASGTVMIDPYQRGDVQNYLVYRGHHAGRANPADLDRVEACVLDATEEQIRAAEAIGSATNRIANGDELRTYRTAVAATGEYTIFHGGTVPAGLAAIAVAMNRVSGIYEREVAVRMELVANNDLMVYTNPASDPYTNSNGGTMLGQNQANLDAVIGSANYDIGHVFSTGGGGVASLGVVCINGSKARGVTGLPSPVGDRFYVDYVAHEMGHQYNATHTFNGNAGSCGGNNRTASSAYEPGSGSTIMAYAGICGGQNIQFQSDDYFHTKSYDQIVSFTNFGQGSSCPVVTATGNTPPVPVADQTISHIPLETPFTLTGSATDGDGDILTYCWEEYDLGPAGHPNSTVGTAPIFRSFLPADTPSRTFPQWSDIVNNTQTQGEILPTYGRILRFRLSARDNRAGGGGGDSDQIFFNVDDTAGPFEVTVLNTPGIVWNANTPLPVTWDVANTTNGNVDCQTVDIMLSTDGGFTYPTALVSGTPNDGSEVVSLPFIDTTTARIMVAAADNVFFDINDRSFEITTEVAVGDATADAVTGLRIMGNRPNPFNPVTHISFNVAVSGQTTLRVYDGAGRLVAVLANGFLTAGLHTRSWNGRDTSGRALPSGVYHYQLEGAGGEVSARRMVLTK